MVDLSDVARMNRLMSELEQIGQAIALFNLGARIMNITVGRVMDVVPPSVTVDTSYIQYPPQMIDAIKAAFTARENEIRAELTKYGVTGVR
jgi:hypothetical protein